MFLPSFILHASSPLAYIHSIRLLFFASTSGLSRALNMYASGHAKRAREYQKKSLHRDATPFPLGLECIRVGYLSIRATGRLGNIESSSNDSIVLTHKSILVRAVATRGRWTFWTFRTHFMSDETRTHRVISRN